MTSVVEGRRGLDQVSYCFREKSSHTWERRPKDSRFAIYGSLCRDDLRLVAAIGVWVKIKSLTMVYQEQENHGRFFYHRLS